MYEAAIVIRHRVKRSLHLKDWAEAIERRSGPGKARVALARKLSLILHSVWRSGEPFRWGTEGHNGIVYRNLLTASRTPVSLSGEGAGNCAASRWARDQT